MFRRSRFSIRPNVGTAGRTAATPQEAPSANQEASETPKDVGESSAAAAVTDDSSVVTPSEKPAASGDGNEQNGEGASSSAAVQRRKRFSIKPKVAPGRPSALARKPKSPVKAASETPVEVLVSDLDKPTTSSQATASPQRLQSPRRRRPSEDSKQPKMQPKPTLIASDSPEHSAVPTAKTSQEQICASFSKTADSSNELESTSGSQVEEVPSTLPDKVPPSLPEKEAIEISEKAKTLVSSKSGSSLSPPAFSLSRLLNDPSDLQRLAKARKLRELLKQEMHKEKKNKKANARVKEYTLDPAKMTMRDLIHYLPLSNPMTSSLEESIKENETVVPPSPAREESPERAQEPEVPPKPASPRVEEEGEAEEEGEEEEEEQDDGIMVPQVKVAEDGTLIIDEESLTVEVQRAKGPNPAQDRDPIFERGSTTTYSSFRKGTYSKPWSSEETDMFFLAISMVGTDFSMICQLFPHRARSEIKNKFKKEERENSWRIDKAFRERRKLDIEYFSKLLEKILEVQKNRKKLKSLAGKKSPKKHKRKPKGKKAARKLSVVDEEDEEEQNEIPDLEEEGEKENEDLCNEGGATVAKPKKKRKRKDSSTEEPNDKKNKTGEKSNEQDEAYIPGDTEAALPEDCPTTDMSGDTESVSEAKDTTIKPAKLSRGRAPKPLLPLGRKWGKKPPPPSTKTNDTTSEKGDESVIDGASQEQVNKDASALRLANKGKSANDDSEEDDTTVPPPRPTRYGRVPKPTKPLNYPAKEDALETTPASPAGSTASAARPKPKCTAKRGRSSKTQPAQESKKPKLVTLRASQSEYSDEEDEQQREEEEEVEEEQHPACSFSKDSTAPVFVPASLRSPHPVISEVEETMEELDILANMPDVLGISQDALCSDASCERAQNETGTAEPCEHQLDLLVDVIDFLSSENTEVTEDESYNEAAQTLLTIGNLAHLSQSAQNQTAIQDHITETLVSVNETIQHLEEEIASMPAEQEENSATLIAATSVHGVTETSETVTTVEIQNSTTDNDDIPVIKSSDQRTCSDMDPTTQLHSNPESSKTNSPQTRRGHLSKVKPKPNLVQASRTAQSKSQPETSTIRTAEESHIGAPEPFQATETPSAAEETPKIADCSKTLLTDEISCFEVKHTEETSGSQTRSVDQVKSGAATSDQSASEIQSCYLSETQFDPSLEQSTRDSRSTSGSTDELLMSHVGTSESICKNPLTSDAAVTESLIGQGSNIDSASVQESSNHPAPCVTPVEELPVSQKEESDVEFTHQPRKSRFQKVKPKLNLAQISRTVRSKPQTTKDTIEKDSNSTPNPELHQNTMVEVKAEPTCITSPEKQSQSSASDLIPSLDSGTTLTPTEDPSTTEEKKTDVGLVAQIESDSATSHKSASEVQNVSEAQFEPSLERSTRDEGATSESTDEILMSHVGTAESSCNNLLTSDTSVTESHVGQGSSITAASVQESINHPAPCVTPVEELPVRQKEESDVESTHQPRKSRFQKVKPKPNLLLTSRNARPKPQTTKDTIEKDSNRTPIPKFDEKIIVEVEAEPTCTTSPEKQSQSPASDLIPSLDSGTLTPIEELSTTEEKKTDVGLVGQVETGSATSHQSASEIQNQFEANTKQATRDKKPVTESTDEVLVSHVETTESSCHNPPTPDSAVTQSQVGQGSNIDSDPVQESNNPPASCVTPVEELPVSQKEETEVRSTCQTTRGRFQKVKPKPNLRPTSRTARSHTGAPEPFQATETPSAAEETPKIADCSKTLLTDEISCFEVKHTEETSGSQTRSVGQVKSGAATSDQSASEIQSCYLSETQFDPSLEQSTRDSRSTSGSTDEVLVSHVETTESCCHNPPTPDSAVTQSQVGQGSNIDSDPVQESNNPPASCVTPVEELPVSQKEETEVRSTCQTTRGRFQKVKPKPNLRPTSRTARPKPQTTQEPGIPMQLAEIPPSPTSRSESTDNIIAEVEAQPTCSTTLPEKPSQIKSTGTASVSVQSLELFSNEKNTEELVSTEEQKTDVGCGLESNSEGSEQNVPQRRRRFPKVKPKPNLGSSPRTTRTKLQSNDIGKPSEQCHMDTSLTSEQQPVDNNNTQTERELSDSKQLTATHCSLRTELLSSTILGPAESEKSPDSTNDKGTSSDGVVIATSWVAENQSLLTDSVLENKSSGKPTVKGESTGDQTPNNQKMEAGPASQWDCKQDISIRASETNTQSTDDPTAVSDVQSSEDGSTESKTESILPTNAPPTPEPKESAQQPRSEKDSEAQSRDAVQLCSETNQTAAQSTDDSQSEPTECPSRKASQAHRGWLIKPKPRLVRSSRPPQPRQVQITNPAEADLDTPSEGVDASVCHKLECQPDIQEPVEGAIEQCSNQNSSENDAGSSLGCLTQVPWTQDPSTSSIGGTQSHPSLTMFPDMLSQQEPSDLDEPFFILSLTEIPVSSSGEVVDSVPEPLPYLPVTDVSVEQQSAPGPSLVSAGDRPLSNVALSVSSGETGLIGVKDIGPEPAAYIGLNTENPVNPHESTVHPSKLPETVENNETEIPPTKQTLMGARRREPAKVQVKPNTTKRKQASKTSKEAESIPTQTNTTQHSELPGPSVQPKASDDDVTETERGSGDHVDVEKETGGEGPEESSSGAKTTRNRGASSRNRKAKGSLAPPSDSSPGKAASKGSKVRTPRAAGKRSTPAPVASTSCDVTPTRTAAEETHSASSTSSPTQTEVDTEQTSEHSRLCSVTTLSTSPCPAEVSASQQGDYVESSSVEEEPTSVSQYFLSDIFTEVEEG